MKYIVRSVDGDEYGPFSRTELQKLVEEERLGPGDFIRRESGKTWSPFEKIAGLATSSEPEAPSLTTITPRRPVVGAEVAGSVPVESAPAGLLEDPQEEAVEDVIEDAIDEAVTEIPLDSPATPRFQAPSITADPNPFRAFGLPISLAPDEDVRFVVAQSFIDAVREGPFNAILGHRAALVCTSRRLVVIRPSAIRSSVRIAWIDAAGMVGIETRRSIVRLLMGVVLLLYAASSLAGGVLSGFAVGVAGSSGVDPSLFTLASSAGLVIGAVAGLLGILALLTSGRRSVVLGGSGTELVFGCGAVGSWHLAQIDAVRLAVPFNSTPEGPDAPPTRLDRP